MSRLIAPVAILLSRFPTVTETFILREMVELDRLGVPVVPWPLLRERGAPVHEEALPWLPRALFTPFFDTAIGLSALHAVLARPARTLAAWARILWASRGSANAFGGALAILAKCCWAGERLRERGVRHVHAHFATHPATAAWLAGRLGDGRLPWSCTVHAHDLFVRPAGLATKLGEAAFVRCISAYNAEHLRRLLGRGDWPDERLPVIHCGIEPERYGRRPRPGRALVDRPAELLCIASHRPYKGLSHLVEAMSLLRSRDVDARLRILGDGPLRGRLEEQVREAGLEGIVVLAGTCSQEEVASRLAACDLFVLPSVVAADGQMEGIPVALMEALAAELPVVATRLSGIPELVRDGETGLLVEPGDAPALAAAIERSLREPAESARRGRAGRRLVEEAFEIRGACRLLLERLLAHGAEWRGPDPVGALARRAAAMLGEEAAPLLGISRWTESRDALVVELLLPAASEGPGRRVVAKRHRDRAAATSGAAERAAREHGALAALHAEGLEVPAALGLEEEEAIVLMEAIEGPELEELLREARRSGLVDPACAAALRLAAQAFGALERCEGPARDPAAFAAEAVTRRLQDELSADAATVIASGLDAAVARGLESEARARLAGEAPASCWTHGDAWAGNLVLDARAPEPRVRLLDLEGLRPGRPGEDAANFLEHLALAAASRRPATRRGARAAASAFSGALSGTPDRGLRIAKALRLAAWSPALARGERRARARHERRLRALLREAGR